VLWKLPPRSPARKTKPKFRLTKDRQKALIAKVTDVLRRGEPTVFARSAATRHGIRSTFCLSGWPWLIADLTAAGIVDRALNRLGARYPTWLEGQREYTGHEPRIFCANPECGAPIPCEARLDQAYCSQACRKAAKDFRYKSERREADRLRVAAARIAAREKGPIRLCEWCQRAFQALDYTGKKPQRFCGLKCRSNYASSFAASWRPRLLDKGGRSNDAKPAPAEGLILVVNRRGQFTT
jgi:hypothetical protein